MKESFLGISASWALSLVLVVLFIVGGTGFAVWYNYHLAVPLENSERHVMTCSVQYLNTQKVRIENDLSAIRNNNVEIAATQDQNLKTQLQAQEQGNADDIYNALDTSQCSRPQIITDMPELQSFFSQFPAR